MPKVQTLDSEVLHSMDPLSVTEQVRRTVAENLSCWTVLNTTLGVSAIQEPYTNGRRFLEFL